MAQSFMTQRRAKALREMGDIPTVGGVFISDDGRHQHPKQLLCADANIMSLTYMPNLDVIAGGLSNGKTFLYNISKGAIVRTLQNNNNINKKHSTITSVQSLALRTRNDDISSSSNEVLVTTNVMGDIQVWNWREKTQLHSINEPQAIYGTAVDHGKLITVGKNSSINIYDLNSFQHEISFNKTTKRDVMSGHTSRVFAVKFHPINENEFVTGGWDNIVLFWDRRQPLPVRYLFGPHICGDSIDISSNGVKLLTCSWSIQDSVQVWDYNTAKLMSTLPQDQNSPKNYAGKWATNEVAICGGTDPNAMRITLPSENIVLGGYSNLPMGIYSVQLCRSKDLWTIKQKRLSKASKATFSINKEESIHLPAITFCCGSHLYYTSSR